MIAAGKAARGQAQAAARRLGSRVRVGLVVASTPAAVPDRFELCVGGHPSPTAESERAGRRALELAATLEPGERLLVLLSGGASALMAVPAGGLTLEDKRATTDRLLRAPASTAQHRRGTSGDQAWLAARAGGVRCARHPDVVGDDRLHRVGSDGGGSAARDALTCARFGGRRRYPSTVVAPSAASAGGCTGYAAGRRIAPATTAVIGPATR